MLIAAYLGLVRQPSCTLVCMLINVNDAALQMAVMHQSDSFALRVLRFICPPFEEKRCKIIAISLHEESMNSFFAG